MHVISSRKKFGGKVYEIKHKGYFTTQVQAEQYAAEVRNKGWGARVVKSPPAKGMTAPTWFVYQRKDERK